MYQIYLLKHLETYEQQKLMRDALSQNAAKYEGEIASLFNITTDEYKEFKKNCGHLFKAGMRYKTIGIGDESPTYNGRLSLIKGYDYINNTYSSSKIFCKEFPIIQNILESYLPPQPTKQPANPGEPRVADVDAPLDFSKSYITDFKVFYLFANYDKKNAGLSELKCKNQYDLLENTLGFIEAIYK